MGETTFRIEPLDGVFGAHVHDINLASLDEATFSGLREAWIEFGLLVFTDQHLDQRAQDDLARRFGPLEFKATPIANLDRDDQIHSDPNENLVKSLRGNEGWHHDSTYMPVSALGAVFSAEVVPPSGSSTGFADMRAAYDALDRDTQERIAALEAYHSLEYSQERAGYLPTKNESGGYDQYGYHGKEAPLRPMVKIHPDTGRPNLLIGRHAHGIPGMDFDESTTLIDQLNDNACAPERVHFHHWSVGDVVIWDNRRLMHCAVPFDMTEPRRMWHTRIAGDPATETASNYLAANA